MNSDRHHMVERRIATLEQPVWWDMLSLAQKFSASSLGKFGYKLRFVRHENSQCLAVLGCNNNIVVVTADGHINSAPDISLR